MVVGVIIEKLGYYLYFSIIVIFSAPFWVNVLVLILSIEYLIGYHIDVFRIISQNKLFSEEFVRLNFGEILREKLILRE